LSTVRFCPAERARIISRTGREVQANWFTQDQMMCLQTTGGRECWPYRTAFQANQPISLTSDCGIASRWTALSVQQPMQPTQPMQQPPRRSGERG
jgi:hypothetical protein